MKNVSLYEAVPPQKRGYTLKIRKYVETRALLPHWHEHIELLYFTRGRCTVTAGGKSFTVTEGELAVVNSTEIHSFSTRTEVEYFCILIYPTFLSDVDFSGVMLENHVSGDERVRELFGRIAEEYEMERAGADMMLKGVVYELMAHLMRHHTATRMSEKERAIYRRASQRLHAALDYVEASYKDSITTSDLAAMCYFSEAHFCRAFRAATGKSPMEYINEYRIEKAALLLASTDESTAEIATRVGFNDANYFSRIFKRVRKISPTEYRKIAKGEIL